MRQSSLCLQEPSGKLVLSQSNHSLCRQCHFPGSIVNFTTTPQHSAKPTAQNLMPKETT
ncbi:hypothetical protein PISMIDRAFT_682724 [Pisolithus microcarpus 441]|uniref:Uncharacterized protein n=1 Tax=Pisolithus microcarpus 441 TaxID=765257 RepID=A0A0C9YTF9_9AGAM|nr:hypothetical protein PISMIDRAFT_682724 [Pisolithus microcarpus 441]